MSNHEIEDVLSSIRRLVSEDLRPAPKPAEPTEMAAADKLMLTPALRIVPSDEESDTPVFQPTVDELVLASDIVTDPPIAPSSKDEMVARFGAAVTEEDEWESPEGDTEVWSQAAMAPEMPTFVHRARSTDVHSDEPPAFMDPPQAAFIALDDALPESEPDFVDELAAEPEVEPEAVPLRKMTPPQDSAAWADEAEAAVMADLAEAVEDEAASDFFEAVDPPVMAFDEEVLRDLVRDIIREELSGTLGERITRNVRKLVRAEIARALALREFE